MNQTKPSKVGLRVSVTLLSLFWVSQSVGQPLLAPTRTPKGDVVFQPVFGLHQRPPKGSVEPQLRHGDLADTDDWPASLYATFDGNDGKSGFCTAALVGPRALLSAAHCIPKSGVMKIARMQFEAPGEPHIATCATPVAYLTDVSADFALCELAPSLSPPKGFRFETVQMPPIDGLVGAPLILGGYGCTSDLVGDTATPSKPTYEIGKNSVAETSFSQAHTHESDFYAPAQNNNLFTQSWGANLCEGDSGGPVFQITEQSGKPFQHRAIAAVNSRVFYGDQNEVTWGASILGATGGKDFLAWALDWAKSRGVSVCGVWPDQPPSNCQD